jgi:hypothetical protein
MLETQVEIVQIWILFHQLKDCKIKARIKTMWCLKLKIQWINNINRIQIQEDNLYLLKTRLLITTILQLLIEL